MDFDFWRQENPVMIFKKLENKLLNNLKKTERIPAKA